MEERPFVDARPMIVLMLLFFWFVGVAAFAESGLGWGLMLVIGSIGAGKKTAFVAWRVTGK